MKTAKETIAQMHADHANGIWDGESPAELVCRKFNCSDAEFDSDGNVWIEGPQAGHWLDDDKLDELVEWMKSEGVTFA